MMMRKVFRAHKVKLVWQDEVVGVMLGCQGLMKLIWPVRLDCR